MTATGIAEFLLNKSLGIKTPQLGGTTDLSEQYTICLSRKLHLNNNFTDAVELLTQGGWVRDSDLKFNAYRSATWTYEPLPAISGEARNQMPSIEKVVLFDTGGEGSQKFSGVAEQKVLEDIKAFLRDNESPVLLVYQIPGAGFWHANMVIGYDDERQVLITRDSSFGEQRNEVYEYGNASEWGNLPYRGTYEMTYDQVLAWANHATGYRLR
jgi:hypothetical protein